MEKLKNLIKKLTPKDLVDGKCPNCGIVIPSGEPFWCGKCGQALNYKK